VHKLAHGAAQLPRWRNSSGENRDSFVWNELSASESPRETAVGVGRRQRSGCQSNTEVGPSFAPTSRSDKEPLWLPTDCTDCGAMAEKESILEQAVKSMQQGKLQQAFNLTQRREVARLSSAKVSLGSPRRSPRSACVAIRPGPNSPPRPILLCSARAVGFESWVRGGLTGCQTDWFVRCCRPSLPSSCARVAALTLARLC
jgi:hypothetical protein